MPGADGAAAPIGHDGGVDRGAAQFLRHHLERPLHRFADARRLHPCEQRVELGGQRFQAAGLGRRQPAIGLDRNHHGDGLVPPGDRYPAFAGDALEDAAEAVLGVAGRHFRRLDHLAAGVGDADGGGHGGQSSCPDRTPIGQIGQIGQSVGPAGKRRRRVAIWERSGPIPYGNAIRKDDARSTLRSKLGR